jgi:transposase InsO family protein
MAVSRAGWGSDGQRVPRCPQLHSRSSNQNARSAGSAHGEIETMSPNLTEPSVGSVGDSYDNALAETVIGLFKAEVIHRRGPWRSFEAVEYATLEWVDWFNHRRLLEPIGNVPPAEAEARYYDRPEEQALAA